MCEHLSATPWDRCSRILKDQTTPPRTCPRSQSSCSSRRVSVPQEEQMSPQGGSGELSTAKSPWLEVFVSLCLPEAMAWITWSSASGLACTQPSSALSWWLQMPASSSSISPDSLRRVSPPSSASSSSTTPSRRWLVPSSTTPSMWTLSLTLSPPTNANASPLTQVTGNPRGALGPHPPPTPPATSRPLCPLFLYSNAGEWGSLGGAVQPRAFCPKGASTGA